jgi:hypothetical protein
MGKLDIMDEPFDPIQKVDLAMLRAEHQKRFSTQIALLKEHVGEGIVYRNGVVQVVVSEDGAYYELTDLPEEFGGAAGEHLDRHFLTEQEAVALLTRAIETLARANERNTRHISVFVLYTRRGLADRKNCYVFEYRPEEFTPERPPLIIGNFQPGVMPLFYKLKIDAEFAPEALNMERGMVFCMANAGDRHLLIRIPFTGHEVYNLSELAGTETVQ